MKKSELKKIAKTKSITHCYIRKGPYYRPGSCGYTDFAHRAGVYTKEEAIKHAEHCGEIWLEPIHVPTHNKMLLDEAQEILGRIICASAGNGA